MGQARNGMGGSGVEFFCGKAMVAALMSELSGACEAKVTNKRRHYCLRELIWCSCVNGAKRNEHYHDRLGVGAKKRSGTERKTKQSEMQPCPYGNKKNKKDIRCINCLLTLNSTYTNSLII